MNPIVKSKWLKALRSGDYKQGKEYLRKNDEFCCLGVLCDLYSRENECKVEKIQIKDTLDSKYTYNYASDYLPHEVKDWAELNGVNPFVNFNGLRALSHLNDDKYSFEQIAQLIEDQL